MCEKGMPLLLWRKKKVFADGAEMQWQQVVPSTVPEAQGAGSGCCFHGLAAEQAGKSGCCGRLGRACLLGTRPSIPACQVNRGRGQGLGVPACAWAASGQPPALLRWLSAGFDGEDDKRSENSIGPCNQGQCWHPSQVWQLLPFLSSPPSLSQLNFPALLSPPSLPAAHPFPPSPPFCMCLSCFMFLISLRCWELFFFGREGECCFRFVGWAGVRGSLCVFFFLYCRPVAN